MFNDLQIFVIRDNVGHDPICHIGIYHFKLTIHIINLGLKTTDIIYLADSCNQVVKYSGFGIINIFFCSKADMFGYSNE